MFGLLKKKFKNFTDKVLGKTYKKIKDAPEVEKNISKSAEHKPLTEESKIISKIELSEEKQIIDNITKEKLKIKNKVEFNTPQNKENIQVVKKQDIPQNKEIQKIKLSEDNLKQEEDLKQEKDLKQKEIIKKGDTLKSKESLIVGQKYKKDPQKLNLEKSEEYKSLTLDKPENIKKSISTSIKSIFTSKIKLTEKEIEGFLEDFELSLLEADVSINSAKIIIESLKTQLPKHSYSKSNLMEDLKKQIKNILLSLLNVDCNIENYIINKEKPLTIMFVGPNGAGKTTTISKFANMYKAKGKSVVLASSDTFRAGSIDQLQKHANKIGVRIVKQEYGSDPAAVAYDAVASAKANNIDCVLIDTAGRQETNVNLMQELKKIKRVVNPSLVIYIGEAQSGQAIIDQILEFDKNIGITGVILTKIDTDPKGGVAISVLNELKKPIFYIGTGQEYKDIIPFSAEYIINRII